ncbi:nitroreductase family protein [Cognaticolwellia aestuarii]|uniref:nitroreductase family protein n=1 Tax=Cognaticolwellia aestuarii TaxID=329993 RepID=UPI0009864C6F|nr:nitroreductase family protein [Cognaticolwellia aestuarii]
MNFIDALNWRYAVNQFSNEKLNQQQVNGLIESVRLSASSYGLQPYQLFVIASDQVKNDLLPFSYGQTKVANNSHLLVFAHKTQITSKDISLFISSLAKSQNKTALALNDYQQVISNDLLAKNENEQSAWAAQQCYIALGKLLSYTAINQIDACPMTGFDSQGINQVLGLNKQGLNAEIICPVGFRSTDDISALRVKYRKQTADLVTML